MKNKAAISPELSVSGMLLYARTGDAVQPDESFLLDGSRITARTLDLGRPFPDIAYELDRIAEAVTTGAANE